MKTLTIRYMIVIVIPPFYFQTESFLGISAESHF